MELPVRVSDLRMVSRIKPVSRKEIRMNIMYFIDGDNAPGSRTTGIEKLLPSEKVKLFYHSGNKLYTKESARNELQEKANCPIDFVKVQSGKNAVDFAIAMEIAIEMSSDNPLDAVILVSEDGDFSTVSSLVRNRWPNTLVKKIKTIEQGHNFVGIMLISDKRSLNNYLVKKYGAEIGGRIYRNVKDIFKKESSIKGCINEKIFKRIRKVKP